MTTGYEWALARTTAQLRAEMTGLRRYANKRDASEPAIVAAFQSLGCSVVRMDKPADLLIGYRGVTHLIEVKTPKTQYGKKLGDGQQSFADEWRGSPLRVVRTPAEVIGLVSEWRMGFS